MELINWICLSLFVIDLFLFIFSYCKKFVVLHKISCVFFIPLIIPFFLVFLFQNFPDSYNCFKLSLISLSLLSISVILINFFSNPKIRLFGDLFFLLSILSWIDFYRSVFFLYKISSIFWGISSFIYLSLFVIDLFFLGKQKFQFYIRNLIIYFSLVFLNFSSFVNMFFSFKLNTILLFLGTTVLLFDYLYSVLDEYKIKFVHTKIIKVLLLVISQILIMSSNVILFY